MLLDSPQTLCDSNYVSDSAVATMTTGLHFLIYPAADTAFTVYDGTNVRCQSGAGGVTVTVNAPARPVRLQVFGKPPNGAQQDGAALSRAATRAAFDAAGRGDVDGFASGLKSRGYFTESVEPYAAALRSLAHSDWSGSHLTGASHQHLSSPELVAAPPDAALALPTTETVARVLDAVASMTARLGAPVEHPDP